MSQATTVPAFQREKAMLKELIAAMCHYPDLMTVDFHDYQTNVLVQICAHPNDARILVGVGREHLNALERIAGLLWRGSHKLIQFMPVESLDLPKEPYRQFQPRADWPEAALMLLAKRLTEMVFPQCFAKVESIEVNGITSRFDITLLSALVNNLGVRRFSPALAIIFMPIGSNVGRMIYANIKE